MIPNGLWLDGKLSGVANTSEPYSTPTPAPISVPKKPQRGMDIWDWVNIGIVTLVLATIIGTMIHFCV